MTWVVDKTVEGFKSIVDSIWNAVTSLADFLTDIDFSFLLAPIQTLFRDVLAPLFKPVFALFGITDETVYSVDVITISLLDTEAKYLKNSILTSVLNGSDIAEELRFAIQTNQRATIRSVLNYSENHYIDGAATTTVSEYFIDTEVVTVILETIEGEDITTSSIEFGIPNKNLWATDYVIDNYSYSIETNILIKSSVDWFFDNAVLNGGETALVVNLYRDVDTNVVIDDYTQVLLDPTEFTDTWTRTTTTVNHTPTDAGDPDVTIVDGTVTRNATSTGGPYTTTFVNVSDTDTPSIEVTTLGEEITLYNDGGYYGVVYTLDSASGISKVWFYETALGTYPELNNSLIGGGVDGTQTLPVIALRQNDISVDSDPLSERYLTTKRILDLIGIVTLDDLLETLEDNPDIDLIQEAFFLFGVNLYTEDIYSLRYLFNFFMALSTLPKFDKAAFEALSNLDQSNSNFIFKVSEGRFNTTLSGNFIEITEFTGFIGKIGYVETEFTILANTEATETDLDRRGDPKEQSSTDSLGLVNSVFKIRTQLTDNLYTEVEVSGLILTTYIVTTGTDIKIKVIELVDPDTGDATDKANFIIPISYYALYRQAPIEIEQVIYDAAHLVIYAEDSTHLEYYETAQFLSLVSVLLEIVSLVVLIISLGSASSFSTALIIIGKQVALQAGLTLILKEILTHNLSDAEKLVVLAIFIYGSKRGIELINPEAFLLLADRLLLTVNAVSTFVQTDVQISTTRLLKEQSEFEDLAKDRQEELEAAQEYLTPEGSIDIDGLLTSRAVPILDVESSPDAFYTKSLMINLAPVILSQTSTYVASVLDLNNVSTGFDNTPFLHNTSNTDILL